MPEGLSPEERAYREGRTVVGAESATTERIERIRRGLPEEVPDDALSPEEILDGLVEDLVAPEDGELLRGGWDELPDPDELLAEAPPVSPDQSAEPSPPYREWEVRAAYPTPESMCDAWGRVVAVPGGTVRPLGAKSQLADTKAVAAWLEAPVAVVAPTPDQQAASEVEATSGYPGVEPLLRSVHVEGDALDRAGWRRLLGFYARLRRRWPRGFAPEPDPLAAHREAVRRDHARRVEEDVAQAQRGRARRRHGA